MGKKEFTRRKLVLNTEVEASDAVRRMDLTNLHNPKEVGVRPSDMPR